MTGWNDRINVAIFGHLKLTFKAFALTDLTKEFAGSLAPIANVPMIAITTDTANIHA